MHAGRGAASQPTPAMTDITAVAGFLLDRLREAEDAEVRKVVNSATLEYALKQLVGRQVDDEDETVRRASALIDIQVARQVSKHALAELEARRALVVTARGLAAAPVDDDYRRGRVDAYAEVLRELARPHAGHHAFRAEWLGGAGGDTARVVLAQRQAQSPG